MCLSLKFRLLWPIFHTTKCFHIIKNCCCCGNQRERSTHLLCCWRRQEESFHHLFSHSVCCDVVISVNTMNSYFLLQCWCTIISQFYLVTILSGLLLLAHVSSPQPSRRQTLPLIASCHISQSPSKLFNQFDPCKHQTRGWVASWGSILSGKIHYYHWVFTTWPSRASRYAAGLPGWQRLP